MTLSKAAERIPPKMVPKKEKKTSTRASLSLLYKDDASCARDDSGSSHDIFGHSVSRDGPEIGAKTKLSSQRLLD